MKNVREAAEIEREEGGGGGGLREMDEVPDEFGLR